MTHFLDLNTTARGDLRSIIDQAIAMKTARGGRPKGTPDDDLPLAGRMVALIFEKPSTRLVMARPSRIPPGCCRAMSI